MPTPAPPAPAESATVVAWRNRWRALRPDAVYNHDFGLERTWRENATAWGYPLSELEETVTVNGQERASRTFSNVGLVAWVDSQAVVIGWPKS